MQQGRQTNNRLPEMYDGKKRVKKIQSARSFTSLLSETCTNAPVVACLIPRISVDLGASSGSWEE